MSMFSSGSITKNSLDDYRLYVRVFHAPVFSIDDMAINDADELLCSQNHTVFDLSRTSELSNEMVKNTAYYDGSYAEGLITLYPEDILLGVPDLLVHQYGSDLEDPFSFDIEIVEADVLPEAEIITIDRLASSYNDTVLITEEQSFENTSEQLYGTPIVCTITDYYDNNPFLGNPQFFTFINKEGYATINISDYFMNQLYPGVFRVNIYSEPSYYT
ncbi:unnamed protein product, partial [marine sediment metagenome]